MKNFWVKLPFTLFILFIAAFTQVLTCDLCRATRDGDLRDIQVLLDEGVNANGRYATVYSDDTVVLGCCIDGGVFATKRSPLHHAVRKNDRDKVKLLVCSGALMCVHDSFGFTPLDEALRLSDKKDVREMVVLLLNLAEKNRCFQKFMNLAFRGYVTDKASQQLDIARYRQERYCIIVGLLMPRAK